MSRRASLKDLDRAVFGDEQTPGIFRVLFGNGRRGLVGKVELLGWQMAALIAGGGLWAAWTTQKLLAMGEQIAALSALVSK